MSARDFFIYSAEFLPLAASGTATVRVPIQADSDFECVNLTGDVRNLDADELAIAQPAITIQLLDEGTGRILMDRAQIWDNMIGTAERPFILPLPKTFRANSTIQVQVINLAAATKRVRISLIGYKLFP